MTVRRKRGHAERVRQAGEASQTMPTKRLHNEHQLLIYIYIYSVERKLKAALLTWSWSMCPLGLRDGEGVRGSASKRRSSVWSRFCTCTPIHTHTGHRGRGKKQAASAAASTKKTLALSPALQSSPFSNPQLPNFRNFKFQISKSSVPTWAVSRPSGSQCSLARYSVASLPPPPCPLSWISLRRFLPPPEEGRPLAVAMLGESPRHVSTT
jgi:hypothetical protein